MNDHSLSLSEVNKADLTEVEPSALQAVKGGGAAPPPPDPDYGYTCGNGVPHPYGPRVS
jgi:hypothetical protein